MSIILNSQLFDSVPPGPSWIVKQGFETPVTGYDNGETWASFGGSGVNPASIVVVLDGTQSLQVVSSASSQFAYTEFSAHPKLFCRWMFRTSTATPTGFFALIRNGNANLAFVQWTGTRRISVSASGGTSNSCVNSIPQNTLVYFWLEYEAGTGNNAIARAGWSTTSIKPTLVANGAQTCVSTNGTVTGSANRLYLGSTGTNTYTLYFDEIRALDTSF